MPSSAHADKITGVLSLFDRILIKGHLPLGYPQGMEKLLLRHGKLFKDLKGFVLQQSERIKDHARRPRRAGVPTSTTPVRSPRRSGPKKSPNETESRKGSFARSPRSSPVAASGCRSARDGRASSRPDARLALPAQSATTIVPVDLDRDRAIDLVVPHRDGGQSLVYFNDGHARFERSKPFGPANTSARTAAAGDLDGDGRADLVLGDELRGAFVYANDGAGGMEELFALGEAERVPYAIALGDVNADGEPDVVVGYAEARGSLFLNSGKGSAFVPLDFGDGRGSVYGLTLADLDGDSLVDIVAARSDAPSAVYFGGKP